MAAISILGAHSLNNQRSGKTGEPVPGTFQSPPGDSPDQLIALPSSTIVVEGLHRVLAGGDHPEIGTIPNPEISVPGLIPARGIHIGPSTGISVPPLGLATPARRGPNGGLIPQLTSVGSAGPAGAVAQIRSRASQRADRVRREYRPRTRALLARLGFGPRAVQ